jgi:hypothetical protein
MPNQFWRNPRSAMSKDFQTLALGIVILGLIGYLLFPNLFKNVNTLVNPTVAAPSSNDVNLPSTYDYNAQNPSSSSSQLFPGVNNTTNIGSGNSVLTSGYWVLFVSNGTSQQLSVDAQGYAFIQGLIQSDSKGSAIVRIFLIDNGQIHQYIVSNETFSVISNMATINARTTNPSTSSTPPTMMLPTTAINETLTVSTPSTSGFTVALNPALNGLTVSNFTLVNNSGNPVTLTSATTSDNGATYTVSTALSADQTYTLTATSTGYTFGNAQNITVPSAAISETLTVSNPSTSRFTVALNPALNGLKISNFTLVNSSGNPIALSSATTSTDGATYEITAALSAGQTYTLTVAAAGYTFGTAQYVVVP